MKKLWFRAKKYGYGWYPSSWEGWVVLLAFIAAIVWNGIRLNDATHSVSDFVMNFVWQTFLMVIILIVICYFTGEPPRWRWGEEVESEK